MGLFEQPTDAELTGLGRLEKARYTSIWRASKKWTSPVVLRRYRGMRAEERLAAEARFMLEHGYLMESRLLSESAASSLRTGLLATSVGAIFGLASRGAVATVTYRKARARSAAGAVGAVAHRANVSRRGARRGLYVVFLVLAVRFLRSMGHQRRRRI